MPYVGMEDIESDTGRVLGSSHQGEVRSNTFAFGKRHVLYGKLRPYLNKVALPEQSGRCSTELIPLLPVSGVDRRYLAWLLRRPETVSAAMQGKTGSRMPRANMSELFSLIVPLPPLTEQKRIAAKLDEQTATLARAQAALAAQREAAVALRSAVLRAALDPATHPHWPIVRVSEIYPQIPIGGTPSRGVAEYFQGPFPWVSIADMNDTALITNTHEHLSQSGIENSSVKVVHAGSLLFSFKLTVGKVAFAGMDLYTNEAIAAFEPQPNVDLRYLRYVLPLSAATTTDSNTFGAHMLNKKQIANLTIPLPALPQQHRIAEYLDGSIKQVDSMVASLDSQVATLDSLRTSFLDAAFSGQV
jgi:type I restriction enzyme S subunit